ncbi:signal peptidase II [Spirochaeta thermophila]|uniref:Lipoprotein signal peptidase n=1 Tax=Winmispira thermophila (strain ATCC 49972 / DSM 6192 / RI 19.B1) TaxID=665571 RepID=E0RR95_WINT6|nr:signal peptidase II [Spirochaeta thermophila]ADN03072.1 signal peptidase II [Spirochaeta thermophila DSM 6192]
MKRTFTRYLPFTLTVLIAALDQFTKYLVVTRIPYHRVGWSFGGDLVRIIHTTNKAGAFSLGRTLPEPVRIFLFLFVPVVLLVGILVYFFRSDELSSLQRWALAGILGGGVGTLIDRFFRDAGVVDFIDVKFFGIFGLERWPTFNIADASIVVCSLILLVSFFIEMRKDSKERDHEQEA